MRISFISRHKPSKLITGGGLIDYVDASKRELFEMFDKPLDDKYIDEYKTSHEWHIEVTHNDQPAGAVAIYDYKSLAPDDPDEPHRWHLGGRDRHVAWELIEFIKEHQKISKRVASNA